MSSQYLKDTPSLRNTFGALFIGATIASMLFGITNLQTLIYYKRYPNDWSLYRYSVAILWLLDALHVIFSTHALYYYLIDMYGNLPGALGNNFWSMKLQLALNVAIVLYVQGLYAIRLWKLGRHFNKILPWFVFLAVAASLGAGIYIIYDIYITPNITSVYVAKRSIYTFFSLIVTTDFIIALMMCYYLRKDRGDTKFSPTAAIIVTLMRIILVSGLATSACSLLALIAYIVWPESLIFLGIDYALPKLYVNSLLTMLNYRRKRPSAESVADRSKHSNPTVVRITPHTSEGDTEDMDIGIPLSEIRVSRSFDHMSAHSDPKGPLDYEVQE
ncbi:uncharacterized protein EV420DRAFT_1548946 [Desarmillaria tabescens]|uniref:DUF6534 domain-containing protein n=1 Tax=Armillaria tabescens TaxID=1929756 RepID=A0AA39KAJ8_ARMTA|nr:uncharacterized protein EV420DRAFT_1548946 [Desarmillaria tabescens]KAK0457540.1 hypothetical protein EV420DRAFT_1548946 [Desarmillaria tabescens]